MLHISFLMVPLYKREGDAANTYIAITQFRTTVRFHLHVQVIQRETTLMLKVGLPSFGSTRSVHKAGYPATQFAGDSHNADSAGEITELQQSKYTESARKLSTKALVQELESLTRYIQANSPEGAVKSNLGNFTFPAGKQTELLENVLFGRAKNYIQRIWESEPFSRILAKKNLGPAWESQVYQPQSPRLVEALGCIYADSPSMGKFLQRY